METHSSSSPPFFSFCSYPTYEEWKLQESTSGRTEISSSYPTYEEWKPSSSLGLGSVVAPGSYPTYEEWKQYFTIHNTSKFKCSYPTYEEWKLKIFKSIS